MAEIDFDLDMDELPPVRTFIDGELVDLDAELQAVAPTNQIPKQRGFAINVFDDADDAAATGLGISLVGPIETCLQRAVLAQNVAASLVLEAGYLLLKVKSDSQHGEFEKRLKAHGISSQRASELMACAKLYSRLEPEQRKQVFSLPKTKVMALAAADPEVVQDFLDDPGVDLTLNVRELRQRLRDVESIHKQTIGILQSDNTALKEENIRLKQDSLRAYHFEPQTHLVREECLAHQAECELALNSLRQLFDDCINDDNKVERDLRIEQAWVTIHVVAARAMDALAFLRGYGLEGMPEAIGIQHRMLDDEALRWLDDYEQLERKHLKAKANRQEKRDAEKPKGPGRPKKGGD
ncbi:hypothetical protein [Methylomonas rapida]|uniref:Uncharacterized protein n=1 Tax=Methylomonas rapida TaxID=2963939 RepID=A0ABY7GH96_9GAMM|nr:hypothetical protein [Methylomonas rapida]WAR43616.1 hypothetical protein NM686_014675 [Methylomonas rapida]